MGVSELPLFWLFGLFGFALNVVIPIVAIVLLVKILGRLDDIARRLDAGSAAPDIGPPRLDRPADAFERG